MFDVGFSEILLIFMIALLVLGPNRLPKLAADIGRWAGRARAMARQLRTQLEQEVHYDPLNDAPDTSKTIRSPVPDTVASTPSPNTMREEPVAGTAPGAHPPAAVTDAAPAANVPDESKHA